MDRFFQQVYGGILAFAVGDALGVPVEFSSREERMRSPVTGMRAYGTHQQPAGTWSDDTSMTLCALESLSQSGITREAAPEDMMRRFCRWMREGYWTPYGEVFDMGGTTFTALQRYESGERAENCGGKGERDNGNGSLMRILPAALYLYRRVGPDFARQGESYEWIRRLSSLTHAHPISVISCGFFCAIAGELLRGGDIRQAVDEGAEKARAFYGGNPETAPWLPLFIWLNGENLRSLSPQEVRGSGYVLDTLKASLWSLVTTSTLPDCLLRAVNLGEDTDTVAAVAGGLAGIVYGEEGVPVPWRQVLCKREEIRQLCVRFCENNPGIGRAPEEKKLLTNF